jgi:ribonuclease E
VEDYVAHVSPDLVSRLSRHTGESDVFADLRIDEQLAKALDRKVWLPSGGSLVIDRTEAMTVVDVNTGKFTGQGGNLEETVTRNNLEAAEEIVRQLRLRDIGGIIVIDFIDMVLEGNRDLVLRRLTECLGRDRTKHQVAEVTSLGLVQMTRKRVGQGLLEVFSEACEHCRGRGIIVRSEPVGERQKPAQPVVAAAVVEPKSRRRRGRGKGDGEQAEPAPSPDVVAAAVAHDADNEHADNEQAAAETAISSAAVEEQVTGREADVAQVGGDSAGEPAKGDGAPSVGEPAADVAAVAPAAPSLNGAATESASVPAPRKRARRAASRPAGPPATAS